jgi:hypothetical protein
MKSIARSKEEVTRGRTSRQQVAERQEGRQPKPPPLLPRREAPARIARPANSQSKYNSNSTRRLRRRPSERLLLAIG